MEVNKARKQVALWVTTNDLVDRLSHLMRYSKAEIIHMAIMDMAEKHLPKQKGPTHD